VSRRGLVGTAAIAVAAAAIATALYLRGPSLPAPGSETYEETSRAFYHGLAALEVGLLDDARQQFTRATELVPEEPAAWANLGLSQLRLGELDAAAVPVERALELAPSNVNIAMLAGRMEVARGRIDEAVTRLRAAVSLDDRGLHARFALADELQRAGTPEADAEAAALYDALVALVPSNLAVLLERARLAAKVSDKARLDDSVTRIAAQSAGWPEIAREQLAGLRDAAAAGRFPDAARSTTLLRNVLARVPAFSESLAAVRTPAELIAAPLDRFVALQPVTARPAAADAALTFTQERLAGSTPLALVVVDATAGDLELFAEGEDGLRRIGAAPFANAAPSTAPVLAALDWNHDFRVDLVRATGAGVQLLLRQEDGTFADATAAAGAAPAAVGRVSGLWPADLDMDGDIDLVVGTPGPTRVLRNNGDGTWQPLETFAAVTDARGLAWADLDRDADPDAAFIDGAGTLRVMRNGQAGRFLPVEPPPGVPALSAATVADLDADGAIDLVAAGTDGSLRRLTWRGGRWDAVVAGTWPGAAVDRLFIADVDNNGALDVVASRRGSSRIWIADEQYALTPLQAPIGGEVSAVADVNDDGLLDLLGTGASAGVPNRWIGKGSRGYHWKTFTTRAQQNAGDQRINSFGVGGEIEIKAGLLWQKQVMRGSAVHFGLGTRTAIDVARVVWPNGVPQAEFGIGVDDGFVAEQRLKGSCPWVFAYDGRSVTFVTDFLWRSPLGLRINAQDTAGVTQTEDWVRIRGDQLSPREGRYDVRITAELWETHFFDHVSLLVVDHPADAEVYVDERFSAAASPRLEVQALRGPLPVTRAIDDGGRDVTELVAERDGRYLATFAKGAYQGIARPHAVEFDVPAARQGAPRVLVAEGWVYPTDSSINLAVGQGRAEKPSGLALDAQEPSGRWREVVRDLGFPAGKNKSMLIDLTPAGGATRLRLRTNLEVYWDRLSVAERAAAPLRTERLPLSRAELRFRGFSQTSSPRGDAPETPDYNRIANTTQRWRDLEGYHTRFGDVHELLTGVDDRYVIMNAGDELRLEFTERPRPPAGWTRDFVLIGDGWEKDGDYNTEFSQTVLPLPSHARPEYWNEPFPGAGLKTRGHIPRTLEDDPVYQAHRGDWERFHTRFVRPERFVDGLRRR
jgi:tetratricopeptide (TPR) repeat protein